MPDNFIIIPSAATVGDAFRALDAKANMGWYVIIRSPGRYGAIKASELAKQALAGRDVPTAMNVRLDAFSTSPVTLSTIAPAKLPPSPQMMLAIEFTRPPSLYYEAMRGGLDLAAKSNYDQLAQAAAASLKGVRTWAMPRNDFLALPETSTVGDTFRALAAAPANLGWCVIVRYADHYSAIQTDQLISQLIGQDLPAALNKPLCDGTHRMEGI